MFLRKAELSVFTKVLVGQKTSLVKFLSNETGYLYHWLFSQRKQTIEKKGEQEREVVTKITCQGVSNLLVIPR